MNEAPGDTDPEAASVHLALLRRASPEQRVALALSLSRTLIALSRAEIARQAPQASETEIGLRFVARHYGDDLAREVRSALERRVA
ncbi:MAG: hypothetical protein MUF51_03525 [Vicinamibacteria bacterium]|jgi:hypothetical protein|nr:hypothetical protein [Vicinamibacteria bacterium]